MRYEIRAASPEDEDDLLALAEHLDSVNLAHDRAHVRALLEQSDASFSGRIVDPKLRRYVFLLRDLEAHRAVGTSTIIAQLGRRGVPYVYLDVIAEEKYSSALDLHFHHVGLRMGYSYDGPTEIGGLVVHPAYRRAPEKLGLAVSYVRFSFIAAHRDLFEDELLAELMPPLEADGTSHLWEALGRHFTGMSYQEADRLSSSNKDFIRELFPSELVYASVLPRAARDVIGKVGAQTRGVEKMLRRIGFRYAERVDPFDGGPHFTAGADEVTLIRETRRGRFAGSLGAGEAGRRALLMRELARAPWLRGVLTQVAGEGEAVRTAPEAAGHLGLAPGDEVVWLRLD
ncbi:MAG: arginine N-succinyltransferase [Polyangiaceae bacterium]|nr:arginine N-succinyltransferase [Polyangiaceae bacterium]